MSKLRTAKSKLLPPETSDRQASGTVLHPLTPSPPRLVVFLGLLLLLCFCTAALATPSMTASLDRQVVPLGETVTYTLVFEDLAPPGAPSLPQIPNVRVNGGGNSTVMNMDNGKQTIQHSYQYILTPTQIGDITIPAMQAQVQGKVLTTQALKFKVVPANTPAKPGADPTIGKTAFLQVQLPKKEIFLGEVLPVDINLYLQEGRDLRMPRIESEGFTVGKIGQAGQTRTVRDGQVYSVVVLKTYVAAVRTGQLRLGPVTMPVSIAKPNARQNPFFDFFTEYRQVTLTADPQTINVLPLPTENVPPGFNGTVGSYTMNVTAGPTTVAVGDPITLKVQISGRGLLENLNLPPQPQWRDIKAYPATGKLDSNDPLGLSGVKSFEQVLIPQNHEIKFLPPLQFSFFDPEQKSYRTLSNAPIPLVVRATASVTPPVLTNAASSQNNPPPLDDILHIKSRLEHIALAQPPLLQRPWFLAGQAVPLLAWLALLIMRKRNEALANNPRLRRQRQVAQRIRAGLQGLRAQAEAQQSELFFAMLFRLLQEQLGERLDLPASAITEAVIEERLRGGGLAKETLHALQSLFQTCNQARYAPMKTSQELASLIPKLEKVLQELQQWEAS